MSLDPVTAAQEVGFKVCSLLFSLESMMNLTLTNTMIKVFVGNLSFTTTDEDIKAAFGAIGPMYVHPFEPVAPLKLPFLTKRFIFR